MQAPDIQIYLVQGASLYLYIGLHLALIFCLIHLKRKITSSLCNHCFFAFQAIRD